MRAPNGVYTSAQAAVAALIRDGKLPTAGVCEACGKFTDALVYHHWSYAPEHWTDVIPLGHSCHRAIHAGAIPEPRTGRVYNGTREKGAAPRFLDWAAWFAPQMDRWQATHGASQSEFSRRTGIEVSALSHYRVGRMRPDAYGDRLPKLADMFGLDAAGVIGMYHAAGVVLPAALASAARVAP